MGSGRYHATVDESEYTYVIGGDAEETKVTRIIQVRGFDRIVGEVTYTKHGKPLNMIILESVTAGFGATLAVATLVVFCINLEVLRRVCTEIHWTKYFAQERLHLLAYWLSLYGYLAPWTEKSSTTRAEGTSSCCTDEMTQRDLKLDEGRDSWRSPTDRQMASDIILLRTDSQKRRMGQPHDWRVTADTRRSLQSILSFRRPPWERPYRRRRTDADTRGGGGKGGKAPLSPLQSETTTED